MNCTRCEEPIEGEPRIVMLHGDVDRQHVRRAWMLCARCASITLAILDDRPVFNRGRTSLPLVDALEAHRKRNEED